MRNVATKDVNIFIVLSTVCAGTGDPVAGAGTAGVGVGVGVGGGLGYRVLVVVGVGGGVLIALGLAGAGAVGVRDGGGHVGGGGPNVGHIDTDWFPVRG